MANLVPLISPSLTYMNTQNQIIFKEALIIYIYICTSVTTKPFLCLKN